MRYIQNINDDNELDELSKEIATMPNTNATTAGVTASDLEAINASLADLDISEAAVEEVVEEVIEEIIEASAEEEIIEEEVVLEAEAEIEAEAEQEVEAEAASGVVDDEALGDLDLALTKDEAYASQTSTTDANAGAVKEAKDAAGKKAAGKKAASTPKEPKEKKEGAVRTPRDISTVPAEFFALTAEQAGDASKLEAVKTATMALIPSQKKIAEKFENLFTALSVNKAPSTYVMIAFKLLDDKKSVTSADVVGAYKAAGLGEGTARSQSGQIMNLFAAVGIATRSGQTLTLNDNSMLAERIRDLPKAA